MSAKAFIRIRIEVADNADGVGMPADSEVVVDEMYEVTSMALDDAYSSAEDALSAAARVCRRKADEAFDAAMAGGAA